ncbi:MAG: hypothetical protein WA477_14605, partial [Candidatus Sulfotelmatobacter sp.]
MRDKKRVGGREKGNSLSGPNFDKTLGHEQNITRRDFLNSTLLASGGALLSSMSPAQLLAQKNENKNPFA